MAGVMIRRFGFGGLDQPLTVQYALGGSALPDTDFSTLPSCDYGGEITIESNSEKHLINVFAIPDAIWEGNEHIQYTLLPGEDYEIHWVGEDDPEGRHGRHPLNSAWLTVTDTTGAYTLTVTAMVASVTEGSAVPAHLRITRTGPADLSDTLSFDYSWSGPPELNNLDMDLTAWHWLQAGHASFQPGQRDLDLLISARDDLVDEALEEIYFRLIQPANPRQFTIGHPWNAMIDIVDDDTDPVVRLLEPAQDVALEVGERLWMVAEASDEDDGVASVEFWLDDRMLGRFQNPPYALSAVMPWFGAVGDHQLKVKVEDRSGVVVWSSPRTVHISNISTGPGTGLHLEEWDEIPGPSLNALLIDSRYPQRPSSSSQCEIVLAEGGTNCASRWRGFFLAPRTGNYRFVLQANDSGELWLSPDENPAHRVRRVSAWCTSNQYSQNAWPSVWSDPISLQEGRRYYFETLHKQANGRGWLRAGVDYPGGQVELPVLGDRFDPWPVLPGLELTGCPEPFQVSEAGLSQSFFVRLNTEPDADVTVWLQHDSTQLQVVPEKLVFPRAAWWEARSVLVHAVDDDLVEANPLETRIELNPVSMDMAYSELESSFVPVVIVDNETNLLPQASRVWPRVRQVRTTAANLQLVFEVSASDEGQPGPLCYDWTQQVGPGGKTGTVTNTHTTNTLGVFSQTGSYEVVFTADDGLAKTNLDYDVRLGASAGLKAANFAPVISAGADLAIVTNTVVPLKGKATDDGLPATPGRLTVKWEKISGPGTVTLGNESWTNTTFRAKTPGRYVLRLTVHDGEVKVYDDVVLTVSKTAPLR